MGNRDDEYDYLFKGIKSNRARCDSQNDLLKASYIVHWLLDCKPKYVIEGFFSPNNIKSESLVCFNTYVDIILSKHCPFQ
jgi:hypothetical protein